VEFSRDFYEPRVHILLPQEKRALQAEISGAGEDDESARRDGAVHQFQRSGRDQKTEFPDTWLVGLLLVGGCFEG